MKNELKNVDKLLKKVSNLTKKVEKKEANKIEDNSIKDLNNDNMENIYRWYTISVVSGKEEKVEEALNNKIKSLGMSDIIKKIKIFKVPYLSEKEIEKKRNGDLYKVKQDKLYKGYIFIKMIITDDVWFIIRNTEYVTGLVGSSGKGAKPTPISKRKFAKMIEFEKSKLDEFEKGDFKTEFRIGAIAKVLNGPFENEQGVIIENNNIKGVAVLAIESFGRKTPTEFNHKNLELLTK